MTTTALPRKLPIAHARIGDAVLLENGTLARALWRGEPALAVVQQLDEADARALCGLARAIGTAEALPIAGVHWAAVDEDQRAVVICAQQSGMCLVDVTGVVDAQPERRFPTDVACRLALQIASMDKWLPRFTDFVITWDGVLRASPVPMLPGAGPRIGRIDDIAFLSPEAIRADAARDVAADARYSAGVVAYRLLAGRLPFVVAKGATTMEVIMAAFQGERMPLAQHRHDIGEPLCEVIDGLIALAKSARTPAAKLRAVLGARACSDDEARRFLAGFVAEAFAPERAHDIAFWEEALTLDVSGAPVWKVVAEPEPVADVAAMWRSLSNRSSRTD